MCYDFEFEMMRKAWEQDRARRKPAQDVSKPATPAEPAQPAPTPVRDEQPIPA